MVFITKFNANRILQEIDTSKIETVLPIYKTNIYIFNKLELQLLSAYQLLMQNPTELITKYYKKIEVKDSLRFVYEKKQPAYHLSLECPNLHSDFQNFEIPEEIREKGRDEILRFRNWFLQNSYLLEEKPDVFEMRLSMAFNVKINMKAINYSNSGVHEIEDLSLVDIENKIDNLVKEAGRYYYASPENTKILKKYSKRTFLARRGEMLSDNDTGLSDDEVRKFLLDYEERFKLPIMHYLKEYYRMKYNPDLSIDEKLLNFLNFRPCVACVK